jgi:hypothetical protein
MEMLTGKHVTSEMIENHWKDRKTFETQMLFSACFEDYQNVWTKINEAVKSGLGQDTAIRVDDSPNSNEPYFVNLLMDMHDASPNLFGLLLKTLHPNPLERIGAPELFSQLKSYFGTDSINLKDTLWTLGVDANSLPIKESKPEAATQNQVSALAYLRRAPVGLYAPVPSRQSFVEPGAAHPPAQKPFFRLGPSPAQDPVKTEKDPA